MSTTADNSDQPENIHPSRFLTDAAPPSIDLGSITIPEVLLQADREEIADAAHLATLEAQLAANAALHTAALNYVAKVRNGVA